ncbi:MAG: DinB family protein [Phycisphaerales bacterium JB059]
MQVTAETINATAARGLGLAGMMLQGVTPEMFARLPEQGGSRVQTNHAAFVFGHLSIYPSRIFMAGGEDPSTVRIPEAHEELFKIGSVCHDDPEGTIYPAMEEVVKNFQRGYSAALQLVAGWDEEKLAGRHELGEAYQNMFPSLGIVTNFLLTSHVMMHLGQVSAWRRMMGLGSAM